MKNMKKTLLITALFTLMTFTAGCTEDNEEVIKENNNDNLTETENNEQLPLRERIEMEMEKDTNTIENIAQGQFDGREIGLLKALDKFGDNAISYSLTNELQSELLEYIKSISVKFESKKIDLSGNHFDFFIVRPQYSAYQTGSHIGVNLDKKELQISGGEGVMPRVYKVLENEDSVFGKLESYLKLGTEKIISPSN